MPIDRSKLADFVTRERVVYAQARPASAAAAQNDSGFFGGVPQHWMLDWATPFPMRITHAHGTSITDMDGHTLTDLCLGDSGAMFGHSPKPVADALIDAAHRGYTTMLPSHLADEVGSLLEAHFWFALLASDFKCV